jgi:hypothetical protein
LPFLMKDVLLPLKNTSNHFLDEPLRRNGYERVYDAKSNYL